MLGAAVPARRMYSKRLSHCMDSTRGDPNKRFSLILTAAQTRGFSRRWSPLVIWKGPPEQRAGENCAQQPCGGRDAMVQQMTLGGG